MNVSHCFSFKFHGRANVFDYKFIQTIFCYASHVCTICWRSKNHNTYYRTNMFMCCCIFKLIGEINAEEKLFHLSEKRKHFLFTDNNYLLGLISHLFGGMDLSIPVYPVTFIHPLSVLVHCFYITIKVYELVANNNNEQFVAPF